MPKYILLFACALSLALTGSASAASITGTYSVTQGSTAAAWSVAALLGGDSDGTVSARLTSAGMPDDVQACDLLTGGMGTITVRNSGVASAAARMRTAILLDIRRGTGRLTMYPPTQRAGLVLSQRITACEAPADAENGTLTSSFDASLLFASTIVKPNMWTIKRGRDGAWTGNQAQLRSGQTHRAKVRLVGSGAAMNAGCAVPSNYEMRFQRTFRGAAAFLARSGFTRPRTEVRPSWSVPRGRFFVVERADGPWALCGSRTVHLAQSSGRP